MKGTLRARALVKRLLAFSRKGDYKLVLLEPHLVIRESLKLLKATMPSTIGTMQVFTVTLQ